MRAWERRAHSKYSMGSERALCRMSLAVKRCKSRARSELSNETSRGKAKEVVEKACNERTWCFRSKKVQNYSTPYSRVVPHRSTDEAITNLTSEIGRDPVLSGVYGRS